MVGIGGRMNIEEFCAKYGYSESTVRNKWAQVQKTIQKKTGILIEKSGRGSKVKFTEIFPDDRALTMFDETKDTFIMDRSAFSYENIRSYKIKKRIECVVENRYMRFGYIALFFIWFVIRNIK